jgi:hypothetical protein
MRRCYQIAIVALALALATSAFATEYLEVSAKGAPAGDCLGLDQVGGVNISLTPGMIYTVTVDGDARANPLPGGEFDGLFVYYYDGTAPDHPIQYFLPKNEPLVFVASDTPFYAFLVDKTLKDVADNSGIFTLTFEAAGGTRETLDVNAIFNCIGLEDMGAAKIILTPEQFYSMSVTGEACTNGQPDGCFDGVCLFYRRIDEEPPRPIHPILQVLHPGEVQNFQIHVTGWVYSFFVDESFFTVGNNYGAMTLAFDDQTPVENATWGTIKALYR